jgi:hypothetical protein
MAYTELYPKPYRLENSFKIENNQVVETKEIVVHTFTIGDVEDPEIYAAGPLIDWEKSEQGQWVMQHAVGQPMWHRNRDVVHYGFSFAITAKLKGADISYFMLKWGNAK